MKPSLRVESHRSQIRELIDLFHLTNPRVFGSVLYGSDTELSDLDLLVDPMPPAIIAAAVQQDARMIHLPLPCKRQSTAVCRLNASSSNK